MSAFLKIAIVLGFAVSLSGCAAYEVASTAVDVTTTAVSTAADVGGAVVSTAADTVSGSSDEDKDKKKSDDDDD